MYQMLQNGHWRSVAIQTVSEPEISQGAEFKLRADARCASRSFSEGWCPGATAITNLSWEQEQSKKCDKKLTHIVRISRWHFYLESNKSFKLIILLPFFS
jgi:hypothetical protein